MFLYSIAISFVMGIVWMFLLKCFACLIVWFCIGSYFVSILFGIYFTWTEWEKYEDP